MHGFGVVRYLIDNLFEDLGQRAVHFLRLATFSGNITMVERHLVVVKITDLEVEIQWVL